MRYIYILLAIILLPIFEHLFRSIGLLSLFALSILIANTLVGFRSVSVLVIILSLILDTTFHQFFGTHLLSICVMVLSYEVFDRILPSESFISKSLIILLSLFVYMITSHLAVGLSSGDGIYLHSQQIYSFLIKSLVGVVIYHIAMMVSDYTRVDNKSILKMR